MERIKDFLVGVWTIVTFTSWCLLRLLVVVALPIPAFIVVEIVDLGACRAGRPGPRPFWRETESPWGAPFAVFGTAWILAIIIGVAAIATSARDPIVTLPSVRDVVGGAALGQPKEVEKR